MRKILTETEKFIKDLEDNYSESLLTKDSEISAIPTGSYSLDISLGIGGIPRGRITQIYGAESSGKTTLAISISKMEILNGGSVFYVDAEHQMSYEYAKKLVGKFDESKLIIFQPEFAEHAFDKIEEVVKKNLCTLVIIDSIGALISERESEKDYAGNTMAVMPRLITLFLKRIAYYLRVNKIALVGLNQVRDLFGAFVKTYTTPGGHALGHYSSVIISLTKGKQIKQKNIIVGLETKFTIKKNKVAPPYKSFVIPIMFGKGIDSLRDLISFASTIGVLDKSGAKYTFEDVSLGNGVVNVIETLENDKETLDKIIKTCYTLLQDNVIIEGDESNVELTESEEIGE